MNFVLRQRSVQSQWLFHTQPILQYHSTRGIFVVSSGKKKRINTKKNSDQAEKFLTAETKRKIKEQESTYRKQLNELKELTKVAAKYIRSDEIKQKEAEINYSHSSKALNAAELYDKIAPKEDGLIEKSQESLILSTPVSVSKHNLIIPSMAIPDSVSERIGLALKFLISKDHQDWNMVIAQLVQSGGLKGISQVDARDFVLSIPPKYLVHIIPQIEELFQQADLKVSNKIINSFMRALSYQSHVSDQTMLVIEHYCTKIRQNSGSDVLPRESYEVLIQAYGKNNNMNQINKILTEMKKNGISASANVFNNVLTTCVYKAKDHKQAVEVFDTMKFMSQATKPGTRAYQDIIVSYVNNDDIERALDLYMEMVTHKIELNQNILVALARGCTSRDILKFKAWDFMFEIHNRNWTPTINTYEYMLYLASKDGDLALTRALYAKLVISNSTSLRAFGFMMLAYSKCKFNQNSFQPPTIMNHERGRKFRKNILDDSVITSPEGCLPFLPLGNLTSKEEVLAESSAFWGYTLMTAPHFISSQTATTYLNIVNEHGNLSDFIDRYESSTYLDKTGLPQDRQIVIEEPNEDNVPTDLAKPDLQKIYEETSIVKSPILTNVPEETTLLKVPRVSLTYVVALKAAGKFRNFKFAQRIWSERGDFRKTQLFKSLPKSEKDKLDFQFANAMIQCLTKMNLLEDALAILISTEYQFKWTWKELTHLNEAAVNIGATHISSTIRGIARRAQLNFAGKIRRKDYKKYVLERGY